ncbi:hypothetical protein [Nocardioides sp.]|uniref:hypothetical protein n=1 Tax=Nocardioides sp. TaxID=35761 RepID=UPI002B26E9F9|nr:hypothetical protein [Nocardioides sp.]
MGLYDLDVRSLLGTGTAGVNELVLVIEQIDDVVKRISAEEQAFAPVTFAFGASVAPGAFGRADSAPSLSGHYDRAHEVTWKTLRGIKDDLIGFQEACRAAMVAIRDADDQAADHMRVVTDALGIVAAGGRGHGGQQARRDAQQHQDTDEAGRHDS